jgi:GntR family transcriptional repressor for pyruvate dehydrogenase complex
MESNDTSKAFAPVERPTLPEEVAGSLRGRILRGELPPGSSLPSLGELSSQFQLSRPVVREGLQILSAQGYVTISHGRVTRVKAPDPNASTQTLLGLVRATEDSMRDLMHVRRVLEGEAAALAAMHAEQEDLDAIQESIDELLASKTDSDVVEADVRFHTRIWSLNRNAFFQLLLQALRGMIEKHFRHAIDLDRKPLDLAPRTAEEHRRVLAAIAERDAEKARAVMHATLMEAEEHILEESLRNGKKRAGEPS